MAHSDDLIEHANFLVDLNVPNDPKQVDLRRAVSAAYYALFHLLTSEAARNWRHDRHQTRFARIFDHKPMKTCSSYVASSQNALTHGLTSQSPVLATEDPAAYQLHCRQFLDEYQPATPTETHFTQELADTAWRLNRIPLLETALLDRAADPPTEQARIDFDIVDAHRALATLGVHSQRLSRQFQKSLDHLREIQADRRLQQECDLKRAAALLEFHKHKGLPYDPAQLLSENGFVFSKDEIEAFSRRMVLLNQSRHTEHVLFYMQPPAPYQPQPPN